MSDLFNSAKPYLAFGVLAIFLSSCSKDDENDMVQDQEFTQAELKTVLETDDFSSIVDTEILELFQEGQSSATGKSENCYEAVFTNTGFTVTYDNCKLEENGEVLNGSLAVVYGQEGGTYAYTVTYNDLMVGAIGLSGTRSIAIGTADESSVTFEVDSDMSITTTNGSVITEAGNRIFALVFGETFGEGALTLNGEWVVKADGNTYSVSVTDLLEASFGCEYIGEGGMILSKNGLNVSVDFGDGTCDDKALVIYPDGTEEEISLKD